MSFENGSKIDDELSSRSWFGGVVVITNNWVSDLSIDLRNCSGSKFCYKKEIDEWTAVGSGVSTDLLPNETSCATTHPQRVIAEIQEISIVRSLWG